METGLVSIKPIMPYGKQAREQIHEQVAARETHLRLSLVFALNLRKITLLAFGVEPSSLSFFMHACVSVCFVHSFIHPCHSVQYLGNPHHSFASPQV